MVTATVTDGQVALLFFDSRLQEVLQPGVYGYWTVGRKVTTRVFSTRPAAVEITAQEILTRDRVQLRVTLTAFVRVTDPVRLAAATDDHGAYVYKLVQFATREAVAARTLDEVLNERTTIDEQILVQVRRDLGDVGLVIDQLGIKDTILPGEMRALVLKVVEAEKIAQANLIRRREETAATRSLLNTARLIDDNPTLLRLKELEALERVTEKVGAITVHAGAEEGLNAIVNRLVRLRLPD
jgi:regulator of protease activity HflC (stomatin/prohibitin superfamily)